MTSTGTHLEAPDDGDGRRRPHIYALHPRTPQIFLCANVLGERSTRRVAPGHRTPDLARRDGRALHIGYATVSTGLGMLAAQAAHLEAFRVQLEGGVRPRLRTASDHDDLFEALSERMVITWSGDLAADTVLSDARNTADVEYHFINQGLIDGINPMADNAISIETDRDKPPVSNISVGRFVMTHTALLAAKFHHPVTGFVNLDAVRLTLQPELWPEIAKNYVRSGEVDWSIGGTWFRKRQTRPLDADAQDEAAEGN